MIMVGDRLVRNHKLNSIQIPCLLAVFTLIEKPYPAIGLGNKSKSS
jgi:hypothetical protein